VWSTVAVLTEVPSGALADRWSRRSALVLASGLQGAGYLLWIALPVFPGFAAGFVLWGAGGSLVSGAFQALLFDGLAAAGEAGRYARVLGRAEACALAVQVPVAGAATALFALGGYALAGWVSVGVCAGSAALAATLPDVRPAGGSEAPRRYLATLREGVGEAASSAPVRATVLAVAVLAGLDALEEYFPLLAARWGVPPEAVPAALLAVPLVGAIGAALGGRAAALRPGALGPAMLVGAAAFAAAAALRAPAGLVGVTLAYGVYRLVLVVADTRLQERIAGPARATVTSVAGLGSEVAAVALFGVWALGGLELVAALLVAGALAATIRRPRSARGYDRVPTDEPAEEGP
jgi:MFS family permease